MRQGLVAALAEGRENAHLAMVHFAYATQGMPRAKFGATLSERAKAEIKGVADAYAALKQAEHDLEGEMCA